jgi:predicted Zn-dependent protease
VVGFFLDRVNVGPAAAVPPAALEQARAGKFDAAAASLPQTQTDEARLISVFLSGLALYQDGQLEAAAGKFREALRLDSEFFPAAFYLGSCYAAGGRDREAVGAWQTSLVTESDAPFIYTLLGDALLRLQDAQRAVEILKEASVLWPQDDQVQLRLGTAYSMAGSGTDALAVLEPYLARHPEDHERQFVLLRTLYEARAAGRHVRSAAEDRELFARYAAAYTTAAGPQLPLVEQWKKFMDRP